MKPKILSTITFFIGWPLSLIALLFIIKLISPQIPTIGEHLATLNVLALFAGIGNFVVYFLLRSIFWYYLLRLKGYKHLSLAATTYLWAISELKRYIPGSIWALVGRTASFKKQQVDGKTTVAAFIIESQYIILGTFVISLMSLPFLIWGLAPWLPYKHVFFYGILLFSSLLLIGTMFAHRFIPKFLEKIAKHVIFPFTPLQNMQLLFLMTTSMFCFGLATYFSVLSVTYISSYHLLMIIGFFAFALLVGYVAIIMPMGLGIREAVMTTGLVYFIPLSLAGFSSLFARIVFTISEVIFIIIAYVGYKEYKKLERIHDWLKIHWQTFTLTLLIITYNLYFSAASFMRYVNFYTGRFDLGNMDQTVWNTLHGRIFQLTDPNGTNIISRLAFHADFILVLLAPFYLLWQDPRMLLLIQTIILSLGSLFVYLIAKKILQNKTLALVFAFGFLLNPGVNYANLYDFHGVTLATTFLLGGWWAMLEKKWTIFSIFLILAGLTKEEVWVVVAMIGVYVAIVEKKKFLGGTIAGLASLIFYLIFFKAIPHARGGDQFALSYYSDFGTSQVSIIKNILFSPSKTLPILLKQGRLLYLFQLLFPLGFLPLLFPLTLVFALPDLIINLFSNNTQLQQIYFQYTSVITPFLFISAIMGIKVLLKRLPKIEKLVVYYLAILTIVNAYVFGPLPFAHSPNMSMFLDPQSDADIIDGFLNSLPFRYSIAATNTVGSHLSHRQLIYTIPIGLKQADVVVFLFNDEFAQPSLLAQETMANELKKDPQYILLAKLDDFVVFAKKDTLIHYPFFKRKRTVLYQTSPFVSFFKTLLQI